MSKDTKSWSDKVLTSLFKAKQVPAVPEIPVHKKRLNGGQQFRNDEDFQAQQIFEFVRAEDVLDRITNTYLPEDLGV